MPLSPIAHAGHVLEAALFAPAMLAVLVAIARSVRDSRRAAVDHDLHTAREDHL